MTRLAAFGDFAPLAHSASLARASPVTGFRITSSSRVLVSADDADGLLRTSAVTAFSVPRRMLPTTPITAAPVNTSVMSSHGAAG